MSPQAISPTYRRHTGQSLRRIAACLLLILAAIASATPDRRAQAETRCPTPAQVVATGSRLEILTSGGLERRFMLHIPASYDPRQPTPLVFSIHGFASSPQQQASFARWEKIADAEPMIVVYPQGTGFPARWNAGESNFYGASTVDDVQFFRDMLAHLSERLCIDPARVYANGLSNGGGMTNRLACEASDMIAAIGGVAGAYSPVTCNISRPVPVIAFHGDKDPIVEYEGNAALGFPAYQDWGKAWAERNGCDLTSTPIPQVDDVRGVRYAGCQAGADVVVYTVEGGGHVWPGGPELRFLGKTSKVDATPLMWDFFKLHPMR